jgi:hypothetical protein
MKLTLLTIFLAVASALPNAEPEAEPLEASLERRACSYTTGCRSAKGAKDGKYCGYCAEVKGDWKLDHAYQLNGDTGASGCCDYGYNKGCAAFERDCPY